MKPREEIVEEVKKSSAKKVYVNNLTTQPGETHFYSAQMHVDEINKIFGKSIVDITLQNNCFDIDKDVLKRYTEKGHALICPQKIKNCMNIVDNYMMVDDQNHIVHNHKKVAYEIFKIAYESVL
jgi:uncharacterized cofD-like protein